MKEAMLEALEEIENGMCRIKERRNIWQNSLVYALCQAVRLLLIDKIEGERRGEVGIIKELRDLNMTIKHVMLGKTPSTQYTWSTSNGDIVAEFKIWDWWNGKNISDFEISENYRGLGLSYQLLDYATKRCGAKNLAVNKSNTIAKYVYDKYGFQVTDEDEEYYYMSLSEVNDGY